MKNLTFLIISSLLITTVSFAAIVNVPADYATIQEGIDAAYNGDTVLVQPGSYLENINFNGKNIVVGSLFLTTGYPSYITQTIIDGNQNGAVVTFESWEDSTTIICGFTITNGYNTHGGGISCFDSSPCIRHNIITLNQAYQGGGIKCSVSNSRIEHNQFLGNSNWPGQISAGGGIYVWQSELVISNNEFKDNYSARHGGAIHLEQSNTLVVNNIISGNSSGMLGGGICCGAASTGNIMNNLIVDNIAMFGGGIFLSEVPYQIVNNTICLNSAIDGGGIWCANGASIEVVNSILWNNAADSTGNQIYLSYCQADFNYCDIQEGEPGIHIGRLVTLTYEDNLETDPQFLNSGEHPCSLSNGSECIDAGTPDTNGLFLPEFDLAGNPRINGGRIDIGAYEWPGIVGIGDDTPLPKRLILGQNYPNPFSLTTLICYNLPEQSNVNIVIYDMFGRKVRQLINSTQDAGYKSIRWNATDDFGRPVYSGTFLYRLQAGEFVRTRRMMILK
nr:T9SS type A sorting domain-containing protein [Bacteroidota bacterium]